MDRYSLYAAQLLSFAERFKPKGHRACQGCGVALAMRHVYKALDGKGADLDQATWQIPWQQLSPVSGVPSGSVSQPALLSIAKTKGEKGCMLHICFDNECTDKTVSADILKKRAPAIAAASGYPYVATCSPSHPFDLIDKIRKGWDANGNAYAHILCACPVAWGFDPQDTVRICRMAVETRVFPLYEIAGGCYRLTVDERNPRPLSHYVKTQQRFAAWKRAQVQELQKNINGDFDALRDKASLD